MNVFKGMIFDMDGVLVDSHPIHIRAWKRLVDSLDMPLRDADIEYLMDGHRREQILRHFFPDADAETLQRYGAAKDEFFREEIQNMQPVAGVLDLLNAIKAAGIPAAVATSARRERAELILERMGVRQQFAAVVCADDVAEDKPHPFIYRLAGERLGIAAANLLVAEDAVSGVIGARAAGMRCLGVSCNGRAEQLLHVGAETVVPDFCQVTLADLEKLFA